jgi:pSer/pThr/pTyr-binding forkhead associated (FHA) protein
MLKDGREHRRAERLLRAARRQADAGRLDVAREMLHLLDADDSRARTLMDDLNDRQLSADACLRNCEQALARQDYATALREWVGARDADPSDARVAELRTRLESQITRSAIEQLDAGRIDHAAMLLEHLTGVLSASVSTLDDLVRAVSAFRAAARSMSEARYADAADQVQRVMQLFPRLTWAPPLLDDLRRLAESQGRVRASPLGLLLDRPSDPHLTTAPPGALESSITLSRVAAVSSSAVGRLPARFVLRADGVGGFVIVTGERVTIGPISGSSLPNVPLVTDPSAVVATIDRRDEDYFIRGAAGLMVNDQPTIEKLLANGDRIALSTRCRLTFSLPHAATTTAVIDLVSARFPRGDVRRVILLDTELVIGPGAAAHVRVDALPDPIVFRRHANGLRVGSSQPVITGQGVRIAREQPLPFDTPLKCQGLSFVLTHI